MRDLREKYRCTACLYRRVLHNRPPCGECGTKLNPNVKGNWTPIKELDKILFYNVLDKDLLSQEDEETDVDERLWQESLINLSRIV